MILFNMILDITSLILLIIYFCLVRKILKTEEEKRNEFKQEIKRIITKKAYGLSHKTKIEVINEINSKYNNIFNEEKKNGYTSK